MPLPSWNSVASNPQISTASAANEDANTPTRASSLRWVRIALVVCILLAYHNTLRAPFVLDDPPAIANNATIRNLFSLDVFRPPNEGQTVSGRPLLNLSFAINHTLVGLNVTGYHLTNLGLHVAAALLLFSLLHRTLSAARASPRLAERALPISAASALLWAIHPLTTESVTYISQRAESLTGVFYLLTLYAFRRATEREEMNEARSARRWFALSVGACLAGMASKEVMVSAPLIVFLYDRAVVTGSFRDAWSRHWKYYLALAATWSLLAWLVVQTGDRGSTAGFDLGITVWSYALTQCRAIVHYIHLCFWPDTLVFDHGFQVERSLLAVLPQGLFLVGFALATAIGCWRRPALALLGVAFFALLAPSSSIVPVATQTVAEHRMYLPLACVVVALVLSLNRLLGTKAVVLWCVLALALGVRTWHRNADYQSLIGLWHQTAEARPKNARAHQELALAYFEAGRLDDALASFRTALRLQPIYPKAYHNFGTALLARGRVDSAIQAYSVAIDQMPPLAESHLCLGNIWLQREDWARAAQCYAEALRISPQLVAARINLGSALTQLGQIDEAERLLRTLVHDDPQTALFHDGLGQILTKAGRIEEALPCFATAVQLSPNEASFRSNYGVALLRQGRAADAVAQLEAALRLSPSSELIRGNLTSARESAASRPSS